MTLENWLESMGVYYKPKTTFWTDFTIAEHFGTKAIEETYEDAFDNWKHNIEYLTELVMTLNWKIWYFYEKDVVVAKLYDRLWREADEWCMENLKGDDMDYFLRTTD